MTYIFKGSLSDASSAVFENLRRASEGGEYADKRFSEAMISLVSVYDCVARNDVRHAGELKAFRGEAALVLAAHLRDFAGYVQEAIWRAEDSRDDEWYELCVRRSAIESVLSDHDLDIPADICELVCDLDNELRRVGLEQGRVPAPFIPLGIPSSHWWWEYPHHIVLEK